MPRPLWLPTAFVLLCVAVFGCRSFWPLVYARAVVRLWIVMVTIIRRACVPVGFRPGRDPWNESGNECSKKPVPPPTFKNSCGKQPSQCNPTDLRRIDVLAMGLPCFYGRAIFCDVTVRSPLSAAGAPHGRAATEDGYVLGRALQDKQRTYDDIVVHSATELQVLAAEIGGRWNRSALSFVSILSRYKVSNVAPLLKRSAQLAWESRWWSMLGCGVQDALAASLLAAGGHSLALDAAADSAPELGELLDAQRWWLEGMREACDPMRHGFAASLSGSTAS